MTKEVEDPEVQRNGLRVFENQFSIPEGVIDTFLDGRFDPDRPFTENAQDFWVWLADPAEEVVTECPQCGEPTDGAVVEDGEIVVKPCRHVLGEVSEDEIPT